MSNTKNIKKPQKTPVGTQLGYIGRSLWSNEAVIQSRKNSWWWTLIVLLLTVFLPWIPYLSKGYTANTASLLTATGNYEIDKGFKSMIQSDYFQDITVDTDSDGKYVLSYDFKEGTYDSTSSWDAEYTGNNTKALYKGTYKDSSTGGNATGYITTPTDQAHDYYFDNIAVSSADVISLPTSSTSSSTSASTAYENNGRITYLEAYFFNDVSMTGKDATTSRQYLNNFVASVIFGLDKDSALSNYPHSYVIFGSDFISLAVYPLRSAKTASSPAASYSGYIHDGFNGDTVVKGTSFYTYIKGENKDLGSIYTNGFCTFCDHAGRPSYISSIWFNILILSACTVGSILVASIILIIFSKRKTSLYRDSTNYWNACTEAINLSLTPSIIAFIFGWFAQQYVYVVLIGIILFRSIFLINRYTPTPGQNGENKPLYEARS